MKPAAFAYHRPDTVAQAVALLGELDDAKVLAGGQSLVPLMALRLAVVEDIVDVSRIDGLRGVERRGGSVWIGAATTQAVAERHPLVAADVPLLAAALPHIGHLQIRNRGTIGGSVAHADPASELPAVALTLDAWIEAAGPAGERRIAAGDFFVGTWETALAADELLTGVTFPVWEGACGFAVEEVARRHGDFAIAGACVAVQLDGDTISGAAIGLFGMGSTPLRATPAESAAIGVSTGDIDPDEVGRRAVAELSSVPSDLSATAHDRRHIGAVVVARAWVRAIEEGASWLNHEMSESSSPSTGRRAERPFHRA